MSIVIALSAAATALAAGATTVRYTPAQSLYIEGCGGCHGILGRSSKKDVPELQDAVGRFMCTPEGREYIVRLPNVAFAAATDRQLADLMNFVVFGLGGTSVPANALAYSAAEVGALRRRPLKNQPLAQMRAVILTDAAKQCGRQSSSQAAFRR